MWIKSTKNLAKIHEKNIQNPGQEGPKSRSGRFWAALGCFLVTRNLPDASGTLSRRLWGSSWGRFCLISAHLGGSWGPKTAQKFCQDGPRCVQDASKTAQDPIFSKKTRKMSPSSSDGIFHSILIRFYIKNTSPSLENHKPILETLAFLAFRLF